MNEQGVQTIEKDGKPEYVVVPIEEYRRMVAALEDAADAAAIERAWAEDAAGETIPGDVVKGILEGVRPLRVWRKYRGLTLDQLVEGVGVSKGYLAQIEIFKDSIQHSLNIVSKGYLAQIENGQKPGTLDLFRRLADVLEVAIDELVGRGKKEEAGARR